MRFLNITAVTVACVLGAATAGHSATVSDTGFVADGESVTFGLAPNSGTPTSRSFESNLRFADEGIVLDAFDARLGTLTGVSLTILALPNASLGFQPFGSCTDNGRFNSDCAKAELVVDDLFGNVEVQVFSRRYELANRSLTNALTYDVRGGNAGSSSPLRSVGGRPLSLEFTTDLDRFVGTSQLLFPLLNSFAVDLDLNCNASIATSVETCSAGVEMEVFNSVRADITYTYDVPAPPPPPVPLPAAAWMLLAGLGGMMALRRRKVAR